jgi:type IV fimbrial biogenesis protein FimT
MKSKSSGFTVIELMFTVMILAVLVTIGVPGMLGFVRNSRMSSAANDIVTDYAYARSEAIKRGIPVTLCKSQNGTACDTTNAAFGRWIVFVDDVDAAVAAGTDGNGQVDIVGGVQETILSDRALPDTIDAVTLANQRRAIFLPSGFPRVDNQNFAQFVLCDEAGNETGPGGDSSARAIVVSATGRPQVVRNIARIEALGGCP